MMTLYVKRKGIPKYLSFFAEQSARGSMVLTMPIIISDYEEEYNEEKDFFG